MVKLKASVKPLEPLEQIAKNSILVNLADEMQQSYLEYSLANIARTCPFYSDGLIPVQRRILFAAHIAGFSSSKKFTKCARLTGNVAGLLHPMGDCYGALITMSNTWNNNIALMDFFGSNSTSTSNAAASRYTETRLGIYSERVLLQELEIVDSKPNYDNTLQEPVSLNARLPNLLVFGSQGISVGYATHCLSHNINDVIAATIKHIESGGESLVKLVPDFKQGCDVIFTKDILQEYSETGRASFKLRAKLVKVETTKEKRTELTQYTFENIPYGTNPEKIGEQLKKAVESGRYGDLQIREINDASDRTGDRITVISKRADIAELLYSACDLQTTVSANSTVLNEQGIPQLMGAGELIGLWYENRKKQVVRWAEYQIAKLSAKLHIVEGYLKLLASKTKAIKIIQDAETAEAAKTALISTFGLSNEQAVAILELKLKQITKLNAEEFEVERVRLVEAIELETSHAKSPSELIIEQLKEIKREFGQKRNCDIVEVEEFARVNVESSPTTSEVPEKIRFFSLNTARGVVSNKAERDKNSFVAESNDRILAIGENGLLYKIRMGFKGPISNKPLKILWCEKESKCVNSSNYIEVFAKDAKGNTVGKAIPLTDIVAATSKGTWIGLREDYSEFGVAGTTEAPKFKIGQKHHKFFKVEG